MNKVLRGIYIFGIIICISIMLVSSYAYYTVNLVTNQKENTLIKNITELKIDYVDTSNISLMEAIENDSISKEFTISNISSSNIYYDIYIDELVNSYSNKEDIIYTITSDNINISNKIFPRETNEKILSYILIKPNETHKYKLTVTYTKDSYDDNKTISGRIAIKYSDSYSNSSLYKTNSLGSKILENNNILSSNNINYNIDAVNGLYYTNESIDGSTIYYFRGDNNLNNNVVFNNYCFKIIRTTEDLGIRLIYNGTYENGKCTNASVNPITSSYNKVSSSNAHVGIMYGSASSVTYKSEHNNINNSAILSSLYKWINNIKNTNILKDSIICNDRSTLDKGYSNNNSTYNTYNRISKLQSNPTYYCNYNDRFGMKTGNGKLTSLVSSITVDELVFAGYVFGKDNSANYLNNGTSYYTFSPAYYYSNQAYVYYVNKSLLDVVIVNKELGVRPVISIDGNINVLTGNGSVNTPYTLGD